MPRIEFGFSIERKGQTPPQIHQVHRADLWEWNPQPALQDADGIWTDKTGVEISVTAADCLPILFYATSNSAPIVAIHSGWRGTCAGIAKGAVSLMKPFLSETTAVLGPCLGACCFEVKQDLIDTFRNNGTDIRPYLRLEGNSFKFDMLRFVTQVQLKDIPNKDVSHWKCTYCSPEKLPSYRRNGIADPRIRAWIRRTSA